MGLVCSPWEIEIEIKQSTELVFSRKGFPLTSTPNTPNDPIYPTEWRVIDALSGIEHRQMSDDTHQLRSPAHAIMINTEGFKIFREQNAAAWYRWLDDNNLEAFPRVIFDAES